MCKGTKKWFAMLFANVDNHFFCFGYKFQIFFIFAKV